MLSCGTSKNVSVLNTRTPLDFDQKVEVLGKDQKVPDDAKLIGQVSIGESGFTTKCTYADVINDAQIQSRAMGGNVLKITKHKEPDLLSSCHRISCDVYYSETISKN